MRYLELVLFKDNINGGIRFADFTIHHDRSLKRKQKLSHYSFLLSMDLIFYKYTTIMVKVMKITLYLILILNIITILDYY